MFAEICKSIFNRYPELCDVPSLDAEWSAVSTSGNLYSDNNDVRGWTWSPENGLKAILIHKCDGRASNANGTWESYWGFNISDVDLNEAILLVEKSGSYWDCNGRDEEYCDLYAYPLHGLKEAQEKAMKMSDKKFLEDVQKWLKTFCKY